MENNLYYTPKISEFYVGFEYEEYQFLERNWKTVKCEFIKPNTTIDPKWFRVKYLDQSDVESLGWKTHNNDVFTLGKMIKDAPEDWHNLGNWKYRLMISQVIEPVDPCRIFIDNRNPSNGGANQIFRGTIKNKSELIKLMQQLNIK